jgi:hypothetical protein
MVWSGVLRPIFLLYSPKCLEGKFLELRLDPHSAPTNEHKRNYL